MRTLLKCPLWPFAVAAVSLVGGCSLVDEHPTTKTAYQLVIPKAANRYELNKNQEFFLGDRIGDAILPEYPVSELSKRLPEQILCIEIDIDEDGHVFASRPLYNASGCSGQNVHPAEAFYTAAENAVSKWTFMPARICTFPATATENDHCVGVGVKVEYVPIRLGFEFSFTQDVRPRVTSHAIENHK